MCHVHSKVMTNFECSIFALCFFFLRTHTHTRMHEIFIFFFSPLKKPLNVQQTVGRRAKRRKTGDGNSLCNRMQAGLDVRCTLNVIIKHNQEMFGEARVVSSLCKLYKCNLYPTSISLSIATSLSTYFYLKHSIPVLPSLSE